MDGVASESKGGENCRWVTESVHQFPEHFDVIRANFLIKCNFHELWDKRQKYKVYTMMPRLHSRYQKYAAKISICGKMLA